MSNFAKVKNNAIKIGKTKKKKKKFNQGWTRNVLKSLGYSAQDVISEMLPNTTDTAGAVRDIKDEILEAAGFAKEKATEGVSELKKKYQQFSEKDLKEALEDLKSGKLYNKERMESSGGDFGLDDFDIGFDDSEIGFDEDFESGGGNANVKSNNPNTDVIVSMNIGEDSPVVQSQEATTAAIVSGVKTTTQMTSESAAQISMSIAAMSSSVSSELKLINSEVVKLTGTLPETITSQAVLASKYYEDSLAYQERMVTSLELIAKSYGISGKLAGLGKEERMASKVSDKVFMDMNQYFGEIKKNLTSAIEDNPYVQMLKTAKEMQDMAKNSEFGDLSDNKPLLAKGLNAIMKTMIPKAVKDTGKNLDEFFSNIFLPVGMRLNKWKGDYGSPLKRLLGTAFGVSTMGKTDASKDEYEKGAVAFDGKVHRAITDIIPTYLSKILSAVSGHEEVAFDYEKGIYNTVSNIRKDYDETVRNETISPYISGRMNFSNATRESGFNEEQQKNLQKTFDDFLYNMTVSGGSASWRKRGDIDDIARFTGKDSDSPEVQYLRGFFEKMYDEGMHSELNEMFSQNLVKARANMDVMYKTMQRDGTKNNYNLINNGWDKNGSNAMDIKTTDANLAVDKYGNSSMYYLREILNVLNTGIRVFPVDSDDIRNQITQNRTRIHDALATHENILNNNAPVETADNPDNPPPPTDISEEDVAKLANVSLKRREDYGNIDEMLESVGGHFEEGHGIRTFAERIRESRRKRHDAIKRFGNRISGVALDLIYGKRPNKPNSDNPDENPEGNPDGGDGPTPSDEQVITKGLIGHLKDFGSSINNVVISPLKKALFDKDNGLVTKMTETADRWRESLKTKLLGKKGEDGYYSGGIASSIANAPKKTKETVKSWKDALINGDPNGNEPEAIRVFREAIGTDENGKLDLKGKGNGLIADVRSHIKRRTDEWSDMIFGRDEGDTDSKISTFAKTLSKDVSDNKGAIGLTTAAGVLGSFFLPGGPIAGALLGMGAGIAANSTQLKDVLFGKENESGERTGGVIKKEWQDKFNDNKDALSKGAGVGLIGSLFLPGGPITGAIIGAGLGLATKTEAFSKLLYGDMGDADNPTGGIGKYVKDHYGKDATIKDAAIDTGIGAGVGIVGSMFLPGGPILGALIGGGLAIARKTQAFSDIMYGAGGTKDDPTGGIGKFIKDHYNSQKNADETFLDAGVGAGVGILGSFLLPGGPLIGALIGAGTSLTLNSEKFQEYMFGPVGEDGKRSGGALHRASEKVSDMVYDNVEKLSSWMDKNVVNPLKASVDPIKERMVNFFNDKKADAMNLIFGTKDTEGSREGGLLGAIADRVNETAFGGLKDTIKTHVIDPIKNGFKKLFDGFFGLMGSIIKAPVNAIVGFAKDSEKKNMERLRKEAEDGSDFERQRRAQHRLGFLENGFNIAGNIDAMNAESDEKRRKRREERERKKEAKRLANRTPEQVVADNSQATADTAREQLDETRNSNKTIIDRLNSIVDLFTARIKGKKKPTEEGVQTADVVTTPPDVAEGEETVADEATDTTNTHSRRRRHGKGRKAKKRRARNRARQSNAEEQTVEVANNIPESDTEVETTETVKESSGERLTIRARIGGVAGRLRDGIARRRTGANAHGSDDSGNSADVVTEPSSGTQDGASNLVERFDPDNNIGGNVKKIAKLLDGHITGVGKNAYRIYKLLKKRYGKPGDEDDDDEGANGGEHKGFLKRMADKVFAPFRFIAGLGKKAVGGAVHAVQTIVGGIAEAGKGIVKGILGVGKALVGLPGALVKGVVKAVPAIVGGIGEALGGVAGFIGSALHGVGKVIELGSEGLGKGISLAVHGFGALVSGAFQGIGALLHGAGMLGKGLVKGATTVGGWALDKLFGGRDGSKFNLFGGAKHVIIDGGTLDRVKVVDKVKKVKDDAAAGGESESGRGSGEIINGMPYFSQNDPKYKNKSYKQSKGTIGDKGCGPAAMSMVASGFGRNVDPVSMSQYATAKGYSREDGTTPGFFGSASGALGLSSQSARPTEGNVKGMLQSGHPVILQGQSSDKSSPYTSGGHYVVGTGMKGNNVLVNDPRSKARSGSYPMKRVLGGAQNMWGFANGDGHNDDSNVIGGIAGKGDSTELATREMTEERPSVMRGRTITQILAERTREADEKRKEGFFNRLIETIKSGNKENEKHHSIWSSIFSKKGLITMALIAAAPLIIKALPAILEVVKTVGGSILTGLKEIGGIKGLIHNIGESLTRLGGVMAGTETTHKIDDEGNLVVDENGNPVYETNKSGRLKTLITPTKTRIDVKTGEWENVNNLDRSGESKINFLGHKAIKGVKFADKQVQRIKALAKTRPGQALVKGAKGLGSKITHSTAFTAAYVYADDTAKAFVKGAKKFGGSAVQAGKKLVQKAANDGGAIGKFIGLAKSALQTLVTKLAALGKKFGIKGLGTGKFSQFITKVITKVLNPKALASKTKAIGEFLVKLTGKGSAAAATAFIAEIAFITYGAIDGAVNAGAVFEVQPNAVDAKMRAIAAVFKGLMGTTVGSVVDFINALCTDLLGWNFVKDIASLTYKFLSNDEGDAKLEQAQKDFTQGYDDYVQSEYEAYVESEQEAGRQPMSLDDFRASDMVTTRSEYNSKTNKSLARRAMDGVKGIGKGIKGIGKGIGKGVSALGKGASAVGKGVGKAFTAVTATPKKAFNLVKSSFKMLTGHGDEVDEETQEVVNTVGELGKDISKGAKNIFKYAITGKIDDMKKYEGIVRNKDKNPLGWMSRTVFSIEKTLLMPLAFITSAGRKLLESFKKKTDDDKRSDYGKDIKNFVVTLNSYTNPDKSMDTWDDETMGGEGDIVGGIIGSIIKKVMHMYVKVVRNIKSGLNFLGNIKQKIQDVFDGKSDEELEAEYNNGAKVSLNDKQITAASRMAEGSISVINKTFGSIRGAKGGTNESGNGSGEDLNGMPYYSQNDPRYKNQRMTTGGDTMGESGCGPVAMSMVASKLTGQPVNPMDMAKYATDNGYVQESGTMPGYFGSAAQALGINANAQRPTRENLEAMLRSGNPVILQGKGSTENSPYTNEGHYVVGVGMKGDKVIVNDPRSKDRSGAYAMSDVLGGAQNLWGFSKNGVADESMMMNAYAGLGGEAQADMANGFPFLLQGDARWGKTPYTITGSAKQTISSSACGPTSMAMVARSFGYPVTPMDTAQYALDNGYRTANSGTGWGFFGSIAKNKYSLETKEHATAKSAIEELNKGNPVIASMGPSTFTKGGHYIVLSGTNNNGEILVNDPASTKRTNVAWTPEIFSKEGKHFWSFTDQKGKGSINNLGDVAEIKLPELEEGPTEMEKKGAPTNVQIGGTDEADTTTSVAETTEEASSSPTSILSELGELITKMGTAFAEKVFGKSTKSTDASVSVGTSGIGSSIASVANTGLSVINGVKSVKTGDASIAATNDKIVGSAVNVRGGDVPEKTYNYFTSVGYTPAATAGIMGNIEAESGFNPAAIQRSGKGPAAGLVQWENYNTKSGRWKGLDDYAASKGKDWTDTGSQLEFINSELHSLGKNYWTYKPNLDKAGAVPTTFEAWKQSTDVDMATRQFEGAFERAGTVNIDKRIAAAQKYYEMYANKPKANVPKGVAQTAAAYGEGPKVSDKQPNLLNVGGKGGLEVSDSQSPTWSKHSEAANTYNVKITEADRISMTELQTSMNKAVDILRIIAENTLGTKDGIDALYNKPSESIILPSGTAATGGNTNIKIPAQQNSNKKQETDKRYYNMAEQIAKGTYVS